ncbi:MAG TPA: antibiotic biosynthesis monooxygenase family protein [Saprospiraceae bacterium]|nr:antibiotic biosynthesis monooxygenase family protein [Saprospiraceae bacterium]
MRDGSNVTKKEKQMIRSSIRMTMPSKKRDEALKILNSVAEQCRDAPGCLGCQTYADLNEKNILMIEDVWQSKEDLNVHLRSEEYLSLLLVLEMSLTQPEIRFEAISSSEGIGLIEKARMHEK